MNRLRLNVVPPSSAFEPKKWLKYQVLAAYGLTDEEYLRETIRREPWSRRWELVEEVRREFASYSAREGTGEAQLLVVKFVSRTQTMWLPNVRVEKEADLAVLEQAVREAGAEPHSEIWFCRTALGTGQFSVAGRLLIGRLGGRGAQKIEQVWRCSPRLIERLGANFPFPFVRASRMGWRWHVEIEELYRPENAPESLDELREQFNYTLKLLDEKRERMEEFTERLASAGLEVCSLEYKVEGNRLRIIDWDTGNDSLALENMANA